MTGPGQEPEEASAVLARVRPLIEEGRALCYALVMAISTTSRQEFTPDEIDALCQVAYELLKKMNKAVECVERPSEPSARGPVHDEE